MPDGAVLIVLNVQNPQTRGMTTQMICPAAFSDVTGSVFAAKPVSHLDTWTRNTPLIIISLFLLLIAPFPFLRTP